MTRHPRASRNTRLECDCGAPVVKRGNAYVCVGCGERVVEEDLRGDRVDPTA